MLLPEIDGLTFLKHVKERYPTIPFVFVTAISDAQVREAAMRGGANGYLLKPFTNAELLAIVRWWALGSKSRRAKADLATRGVS